MANSGVYEGGELLSRESLSPFYPLHCDCFQFELALFFFVTTFRKLESHTVFGFYLQQILGARVSKGARNLLSCKMRITTYEGTWPSSGRLDSTRWRYSSPRREPRRCERSVSRSNTRNFSADRAETHTVLAVRRLDSTGSPRRSSERPRAWVLVFSAPSREMVAASIAATTATAHVVCRASANGKSTRVTRVPRRARPLPPLRAVTDPSTFAHLAPHLQPPLEHFNTDFVGSERKYDKKLDEVKKSIKQWAESIESGANETVTVSTVSIP